MWLTRGGRDPRKEKAALREQDTQTDIHPVSVQHFIALHIWFHLEQPPLIEVKTNVKTDVHPSNVRPTGSDDVSAFKLKQTLGLSAQPMTDVMDQ